MGLEAAVEFEMGGRDVGVLPVEITVTGCVDVRGHRAGEAEDHRLHRAWCLRIGEFEGHDGDENFGGGQQEVGKDLPPDVRTLTGVDPFDDQASFVSLLSRGRRRRFPWRYLRLRAILLDRVAKRSSGTGVSRMAAPAEKRLESRSAR